MSEGVDVVLDGWTKGDIKSSLAKSVEIDEVIRKLEGLKEMVRSDIRVYLKERGWTSFTDNESKISVNIVVQKSQTVDKKQLALVLTEAQIAQVVRTTVVEKMLIVTPEARERLKNHVRGK